MTTSPKKKKENLERLALYLYRTTGVHLEPEKFFLLENRLSARLRRVGLSSFDAYFDLIKTDGNEREAFISTMTTHKTFFNREQGHFEKVLEMVKKSPKRKWMFLCGACSTGQEVYTLAAHLENLKTNKNFDYKILGLDICQNSIRTANFGRYTKVKTDLRQAGIDHYFTHKGDNSEANATLKENVKFRKQNLMELSLPEGIEFDVIFLRNVLIYFDQRGIKQVINNLSQHQTLGSKLFVGMSEHFQHPLYKAVGGSCYERHD